MLPTEYQHYLERGCIYVSTGEGVVQTVLGSCVSVCLWDDARKCGGMNHFIHPHTTQRELATPRYGNVATVGLIKLMQEEGCSIETLGAHIIGGGHPDGAVDSAGSKNVEVARRVLIEKGVRILSEDVGGCVGRKVIFNLVTGDVIVMKVGKVRTEDWID